MSDPKKDFMCQKCGSVENDKYRLWGKQTPCWNCRRLNEEERLKRYKPEATNGSIKKSD